MKTNTGDFVPNKYRPAGIVLQDPRNMHLDDIHKVLQHCYNCQAESGAGSAFWFSLIVGSKRKHVSVIYPGSSNDQGNKSDPPDNCRKKKKGKGKQREDQNQGNDLEENPYNHNKKKGKGRQREDQLRELLPINQSEETPTLNRDGTEHDEC